MVCERDVDCLVEYRIQIISYNGCSVDLCAFVLIYYAVYLDVRIRRSVGVAGLEVSALINIASDFANIEALRWIFLPRWILSPIYWHFSLKVVDRKFDLDHARLPIIINLSVILVDVHRIPLKLGISVDKIRDSASPVADLLIVIHEVKVDLIHFFYGVVGKQDLLLDPLTPSAVILLHFRWLVRIHEVVSDGDTDPIVLGAWQADTLADLSNKLVLLQALCLVELLQGDYWLRQVEHALLRRLCIPHPNMHQNASFPKRRMLRIIIHVAFDRPLDQTKWRPI